MRREHGDFAPSSGARSQCSSSTLLLKHVAGHIQMLKQMLVLNSYAFCEMGSGSITKAHGQVVTPGLKLLGTLKFASIRPFAVMERANTMSCIRLFTALGHVTVMEWLSAGLLFCGE